MDDIERFWERVMPEPNSGCWLWTGSLSGSGYGQFWDRTARKLIAAHRVSYEYFVGEIKPWPDSVIDHLCENKMCVNPSHLQNVTQRENALRSDCISAINYRKTHCPAGHRYTPETTYRYPNGHRSCRVCKRMRDRKYYHQDKARAFLGARK